MTAIELIKILQDIVDSDGDEICVLISGLYPYELEERFIDIAFLNGSYSLVLGNRD